MAHHPDRDEEYAAFLAAEATPLTRAAWQLAGGDRDAAAELLQTALVKTYLAWPRIGPAGALEHTLGAMGAAEVPDADAPADVPLDVDHLLAEGRNAARGRRMGWTVAGLASLAVLASVVTPVLIASTVPPIPTAAPSTSPPVTASPSPTATPAPDLAGSPWQVAGFDGVAFGPSRTMTIQFDGGLASGFSGCTDYRASYTSDGDRLRFDDLPRAATGCPGEAGRQEKAFLAALKRVHGVRTGLNGPVLVTEDSSPAVALIPLTPDAATWRLTDSEITLTVQDDRLSGRTGCGDYAADLVRSGDTWTVSNPTLTSVVRCPHAANERAARYLERLGQVSAAQLDASRLTLSGPGKDLTFTVAG